MPRGESAVVAAVSVGGGLGAAARYGAFLLTPEGAFPWTTFAVNAVGCAVIGVFMTVLLEAGGDARGPHRLVRPFFGTGVLGGFTTFSTYAADARSLGVPGTGLGYLVATPLVAVAAAWTAAAVTRRLRAGNRRSG